MDSMILPQVHLTIPAEGLDLGHAEQACTLFYYQQPLSSQGLTLPLRLLLSRADYILSPQQFVPLDPPSSL
jgi:hypothetical protein